MKSSIVKRSIVLAGHKTSVSLEEPFYQALKTHPAGIWLAPVARTLIADRLKA